jgi:CDP-diacylglycerol--glycerol-3-phosphate 3-phosphatidyltransferase
VLLVFAYSGMLEPYKWLLLGALLSDILDGLIARGFGLASALGALLDSLADALLMIAAGYGIWVFHPAFLHEHALAVTLVLGLWLAELLASLWRYGKLSSFHLYSVRLGAYALGIFIMVLFLWGFNRWVFYVALITNVVGYLEEFLLLVLLPDWSPNVRGIYWVLRSRKQSS